VISAVISQALFSRASIVANAPAAGSCVTSKPQTDRPIRGYFVIKRGNGSALCVGICFALDAFQSESTLADSVGSRYLADQFFLLGYNVSLAFLEGHTKGAF
jgi:hypothetical protein